MGSTSRPIFARRGPRSAVPLAVPRHLRYAGRASLARSKESEYRHPGSSPFVGRVARMASTMGGGPLA